VLKEPSLFFANEPKKNSGPFAKKANQTVTGSNGFFLSQNLSQTTRSVSVAPAERSMPRSYNPAIEMKEVAEQRQRGIASLVQASISMETSMRVMTPKTRQLHIDKITTNLPEAYEKFFLKPVQNQMTGFVSIHDDTMAKTSRNFALDSSMFVEADKHYLSVNAQPKSALK
jgi:hypothetical protein